MAFPPRRRPGWRGRIGVIQPAPGVMLEQEWPAYLPPDMLFPIARIRMADVSATGYAVLASAAPEAARDLTSAGADVVAYACTIGSLYAGIAAEAALLAALAAASGKPAIGLADASMQALHAVGARRVAVLTPYAPATNQWVADYLVARGFTIAGFAATPVDIVTVGDLSAEEIASLAIDTMRVHSDANALWMPCTAMRTLDAIAAIETSTGKPAISGSQALLWLALRTIGVADPVAGAGRLLA